MRVAALGVLMVLMGADAPLVRPGTMLPPSERAPLPSFQPLTGRLDTDAFAPGDVRGRVTVVNLWYEF